MEINHETAMKLWEERHGKRVQEANDRKGHLMKKAAYGDENSDYGWNIHHLQRRRNGGTDAKENLEIVHFLTHEGIHWTIP
jgi:hypothetical protein